MSANLAHCKDGGRHKRQMMRHPYQMQTHAPPHLARRTAMYFPYTIQVACQLLLLKKQKRSQKLSADQARRTDRGRCKRQRRRHCARRRHRRHRRLARRRRRHQLNAAWGWLHQMPCNLCEAPAREDGTTKRTAARGRRRHDLDERLIREQNCPRPAVQWQQQNALTTAAAEHNEIVHNLPSTKCRQARSAESWRRRSGWCRRRRRLAAARDGAQGRRANKGRVCLLHADARKEAHGTSYLCKACKRVNV